MNEEELEKQIGLEEQEEITEEIEQEESESGGIVKEESKELEEAKIRYELVNKNVFKRDTIYKVVTFASLAIVVMASSSIAGIMFASSSKKEIEERLKKLQLLWKRRKKK